LRIEFYGRPVYNRCRLSFSRNAVEAGMTMDTLTVCSLAISAYLLGSIPCGLVLTRLFSAVDVRRQGSGNIGATNVARLAGLRLGAATLAGDALKGWLPVVLASALAPPGAAGFAAAACALAAFFGHLYPFTTRFRGGGKGVATAAGGFGALAPAALAACLGIFLAVFLISRRVSAASLGATAALPGAVLLATHSAPTTAAALAAAVFIFLRHAENIRRLRAGTEPRFSLPKKPDPTP
jgi:glycerol-3-phosphate acyltransferase PlsY